MRLAVAGVIFFVAGFLPISASGETILFGGNEHHIELQTGKTLLHNGRLFKGYRFQNATHEVFPNGRLFVSVAPGITENQLEKELGTVGCTIEKLIPRTKNTRSITCTRDPIESYKAVSASAVVSYVEPDFYYSIQYKSFIPDDPFFNAQWHLENTGQTGIAGEDSKVAAAWRFLIDKGLEPGKGIKLGIIDDGFDVYHEDLEGQILHGLDLSDNDYMPLPGDSDPHGTCVTGVAAARWMNGKGVTGACPGCRIVPVRVSGNIVDGMTEIAAFSFLLDRGVDIISNSWGPTDRGGPMDISAPLKEIFKNAVETGRNGKGVIIIFAAGNGNENISQSATFDGFAASPYTFAVGAVNASGLRAMYSDFGRDLDIVAPSCDIDPDEFYDPFNERKTLDGIWTVDVSDEMGYAHGNYTAYFGGTSSAAPLAAGIIGLMLAANPELTRDEVYRIITETADKVSPEDAEYNNDGFSLHYGYGRINALKAVEQACAKSCGGIDEYPDEKTYQRDDLLVDRDENIDTVSDTDTVLMLPRPGSDGCSLAAL